jgi:hypothetical protein
MVASVGGRRSAVTPEQVAAAMRWRGVPATSFSVHAYAPEDFLIVLESAELRRHVAALPSILVAGAPLAFWPWNCQSQARQVPLRSKVYLVIEGLPPHAWDVEVVEDLLGKSCAVEEVAPATRLRADLSLFKLSAWTSELGAIPVACMLAVPEPLREELSVLPPVRELPVAEGSVAGASVSSSLGASVIKTLQYHILIHVVAVEEVRLRMELVLVAREMVPRVAMAAAVKTAATGEERSSGGIGSWISAPGRVASFRRGVVGQVAQHNWGRGSRGAYPRWTDLCLYRSKALRLIWRRQLVIRVSLRRLSISGGKVLGQWARRGCMHSSDQHWLCDRTLRRWHRA